MQYDVQTPSEYLEALEDDWRKNKLLEIRRLILAKAPEIREDIQYKMLWYGNDKQTAFQLNVQKHYVSLYVGDTKQIDENGDLLKGLNAGKGCIRFSQSITIQDTHIEEFIGRTIDLWKKGQDMTC